MQAEAIRLQAGKLAERKLQSGRAVRRSSVKKTTTKKMARY